MPQFIAIREIFCSKRKDCSVTESRFTSHVAACGRPSQKATEVRRGSGRAISLYGCDRRWTNRMDGDERISGMRIRLGFLKPAEYAKLHTSARNSGATAIMRTNRKRPSGLLTG